MNIHETNPYDILLAGVYAGFMLAAILNCLLLKLYGLKGLPISVLTNTVMQATFLSGFSVIDRGKSPPLFQMVVAMIYFILLTSIWSGGTYIILKRKGRSPEIPSSLALFLCSIFFWEFYIPALFALFILLIPARDIRKKYNSVFTGNE